MSVLVVAAHPDDEVLGAGATIAALARAGVEVTVAILGEGVTSRHASRDDADPEQLAALRDSAARAAAILGVPPPRLFGLPDQRFDTLPLLEVVHIVEGLVEEVRPGVIYTHHGADLNADHGVVHRAVVTATRPGAGSPVSEVLAFEIPSSTEWSFAQFGDFRPSVFRDVSDTIELKLAAMEAYELEARPSPHPRSPAALAALARHRGAASGLAAAEAFELIRRIDAAPGGA